MLFALSYSGYQDWLNKLSSQILLWSVAVTNSILVFTNEWHGLIWNGFTNNEQLDNVLIFQHGPGFYGLFLQIMFSFWRYFFPLESHAKCF
ncbi:MAG: hypothetical protein HC797_05450 [Anaerolineales bacterium]|nr:hypothetical protein [Anaerolineales bacterium]